MHVLGSHPLPSFSFKPLSFAPHVQYAVPAGSADGDERPLQLNPDGCCHQDILYSLHYAITPREIGQECWLKMGKL